jgi:hypothetical protein
MSDNYFLSYRVTQYYNKCTRAAQNTPAGRELRTPGLELNLYPQHSLI